MAQVVEHLPCMSKELSSIPSACVHAYAHTHTIACMCVQHKISFIFCVVIKKIGEILIKRISVFSNFKKTKPQYKDAELLFNYYNPLLTYLIKFEFVYIS
jgi:hypothetical protein